jgi:hypothetical protein
VEESDNVVLWRRELQNRDHIWNYHRHVHDSHEHELGDGRDSAPAGDEYLTPGRAADRTQSHQAAAGFSSLGHAPGVLATKRR